MESYLEGEKELSLDQISPPLVSEDVAVESSKETKASSGTALVTRDQVLPENRGISTLRRVFSS
jgi:hypothetical protein